MGSHLGSPRAVGVGGGDDMQQVGHVPVVKLLVLNPKSVFFLLCCTEDQDLTE